MKTTIVSAAIVGSGGFLGAVFRYGLSSFVHRYLAPATFPLGTLVVNLLGCFAIGLAAGLLEARTWPGPELRRFAVVGVLGGFTTYSTFGYDTFALLRASEYLRAFANVGIHVLLGLALLWAGYGLTAPRVS